MNSMYRFHHMQQQLLVSVNPAVEAFLQLQLQRDTSLLSAGAVLYPGIMLAKGLLACLYHSPGGLSSCTLCIVNQGTVWLD